MVCDRDTAQKTKANQHDSLRVLCPHHGAGEGRVNLTSSCLYMRVVLCLLRQSLSVGLY
jgi:hypothetical protein